MQLAKFESGNMNPIRINIPDEPKTLVAQAGQIVIDAIREAGMDDEKAINVPMVRTLVGMWGRGEKTRDEFIKSLRNLLILNPSLKL